MYLAGHAHFELSSKIVGANINLELHVGYPLAWNVPKANQYPCSQSLQNGVAFTRHAPLV